MPPLPEPNQPEAASLAESKVSASLARQSMIAAVLTLLGAGLVLFSLAWSYTHLRSSAAQLQQIETRIAADRAEEARLTETIRAKTVQVNAYNTTLNGVLQKIPETANKVLTETLEANPAAATEIPRVYLQIPDEPQRPFARQIAATLSQHGFIVPGIEKVGVERSPANTQLRYFYREDADGRELASLVAVLAQLHIQAAPTFIPMPRDTSLPKKNQFELWIGRGEASQAAAR